ncbi:MAG: ABC transporter permease [Candidatus Izemoplasmataceae bacterium]
MIDKLLHKIADNPTTIKAMSSIVAILAGLLVGFIVMLIANPGGAVSGFTTILTGGFNRGLRSIGDMLYYGVPIILTGLSVAFAFRTGLFNIGATGQLTVGAFTAVYIGYNWTFLGPVHWLVAVLGGMLAGAIWGAIPGLLKAYRNVHEVVSSIMLNYVGMYLAKILILTTIYNRTSNEAHAPAESARIPMFFLDTIFPPRSSINGGIFIAILAVIVIHIILNKTTFGYELKSVGFNRDAARYAGMNEKRNIVLSMTIAGSLAGLAGAIMFLVGGKNMEPVNTLLQEGFTGIAIALLGLSSPIGVFFAGIFYGSIEQGGYYLQIYDFEPQIIDIIIAVIIYFAALALFFQRFVAEWVGKMIEKDVDIVEGSET